MKIPRDYVEREERVEEGRSDIILLTIWACSAFLMGWVSCMLFYGMLS